MSRVEFSKDELDFLQDMHTARLATSKDNKPHVTPVWYAVEEGKIIISTSSYKKKVKNIKDNPPVCLSIDSPGHELTEGELTGLIIWGKAEIIEEGANEKTKEIFTRYLGEKWTEKGEYPEKIISAHIKWINESERVILEITPTKKYKFGV